MALFGEKYGDEVWVLKIGFYHYVGLSRQSHGRYWLTGNVSEGGVAAGIRRTAVTGTSSDNRTRRYQHEISAFLQKSMSFHALAFAK